MAVESIRVAAPPAKHHWVPRFYQRGFASERPNSVWVYEKGQNPRQVSIRRVGMKTALYGFSKRTGEVDTESIEKELSRIDDYGAKVIQRIERKNPLDDKGRRRLCKFVSVMWRRTPKHMEQVNKMATEWMPGFFETRDDGWLRRTVQERFGSSPVAESKYHEWKSDLEQIRNQYSQTVPDFLFASNTVRESMFERVMYFMDWVFFKASPDTEFLTCDDPVLFSKGSGLKDREAVIMFPLSKELFFQAMWISQWGSTYQTLDEDQLKQLNEYVVRNAHKQVYSSKNCRETLDLVNQKLGTF